MSQDIVADALNQIMNAKRAEKKELIIKRSSKVLINLLKLIKENNYLDYSFEEEGLKIKILKLNECRAIKPRQYIGSKDINKYLRRFLPSRKFGHLILSTNKGLIEHHKALENKIGGALIAYFY